MLNYYISVKEDARILEKRKQIALGKLDEFTSILKQKEVELGKIPPQRVTRSHKNNPHPNTIKKEALENQIKVLREARRYITYNMEKNFKGLKPEQDTWYYAYVEAHLKDDTLYKHFQL